MSQHHDNHDEEVKDLGRKARARLEEENYKRREIVRIEASNPQQKKRKSSGICISAAKRKRPKRSSKSKKSKSDAFQTNNKNVDTRIPDVSNFPEETKPADVIRLHGLPVGTTRGDIVRFFSGLDVQQVFVLPTNNSLIGEWDAEDAEIGRVVLERQAPYFRVFCQFARPPVATLAAQRSGETLYLGKKDGEQRRGASIAITQISKRLAKYMLQNMAVPVQTNQPLEDVLAECEQHLNDVVPQILWTAAAKHLGLALSKDLRYAPFLSFDKASRLDPFTSEGQSTLVQLHNTLQKEYERLLPPSFASIAMACACPDALAQPFLRLTDNAAKLLLERSTNMKSYLHMVRTVKRAQSLNRGSVLDRLMKRREKVAAALTQDKEKDKIPDTGAEEQPEEAAHSKNNVVEQDESPIENAHGMMLFESDSDESSEPKKQEEEPVEPPTPPAETDASDKAVEAPAVEAESSQEADGEPEESFMEETLPVVAAATESAVSAVSTEEPPQEKTNEEEPLQQEAKEEEQEALFTIDSDSDSDES